MKVYLVFVPDSRPISVSVPTATNKIRNGGIHAMTIDEARALNMEGWREKLDEVLAAGGVGEAVEEMPSAGEGPPLPERRIDRRPDPALSRALDRFAPKPSTEPDINAPDDRPFAPPDAERLDWSKLMSDGELSF